VGSQYLVNSIFSPKARGPLRPNVNAHFVL
jgi:hypothetical protein